MVMPGETGRPACYCFPALCMQALIIPTDPRLWAGEPTIHYPPALSDPSMLIQDLPPAAPHYHELLPVCAEQAFCCDHDPIVCQTTMCYVPNHPVPYAHHATFSCTLEHTTTCHEQQLLGHPPQGDQEGGDTTHCV